MENYIIINQNNGVFVGEMWGLCFFSDLDPVGQDSVPSFPNKKEVTEFINLFPKTHSETYKGVKVSVATNRTATKEECLIAIPDLVWVD